MGAPVTERSSATLERGSPEKQHYSKKSKGSREGRREVIAISEKSLTKKKRSDSSEKLKKNPKVYKITKEEKKSLRSIDETESSSGTSHESKQMVLPDKLPSETPLTPLQVLRKESLEKYVGLRKKVDSFAVKFFNQKAQSEREKKEMIAATKELKVAVAQLAFEMNPQAGREINLFGPEVKSEFHKVDYRKLNKLLNGKILLNENQNENHIKSNLAKMFGFVDETKEKKRLITQAWLRVSTPGVPPRTVPHTILQDQFSLMIDYRDAIKGLCKKIKDSDYELDKQYQHDVYLELKKIISSENDLFKLQLVEAIEVRYLEQYLEPMLEKKAREIITSFQETDMKAVLMYGELVEVLLDKFKNEVKPNIIGEWKRAIYAGIVSFVDKQNIVRHPPFNDPGEHDLVARDEALNNYVIGCQRVVGHYMFKDAEMMVELCRLIEVEASRYSPPKPGETLLDKQARIMAYLGELAQDERAIMSFFGIITQQLRDWNNTRGETMNPNIDAFPVPLMLNYLMMFYRAPSQTFLWSPTGALADAYLQIFKEDHILGRLKDWDDNETKLIYIQFNEGDLSLKFVRKGNFALKDKPNSYYIFTQDLTVIIPNPGIRELKDAVTVQFYYEKPIDLPPEDIEELDEIKDKLAFIMSTTGFPALKEIKAV